LSGRIAIRLPPLVTHAVNIATSAGARGISPRMTTSCAESTAGVTAARSAVEKAFKPSARRISV
jgi:hypothetical protein